VVVVVEFDRFRVRPCLSRSRVDDKLALWLMFTLLFMLFTLLFMLFAVFASVPLADAFTVAFVLEAMPEEDQMREEFEDAKPKSAEFVD
jgi:hypothetical protein